MIINTELLKPRSLLVIGVLSILSLWLAKRFLPHPAMAGPSDDAVVMPGANVATLADVTQLNLGDPDATFG